MPSSVTVQPSRLASNPLPTTWHRAAVQSYDGVTPPPPQGAIVQRATVRSHFGVVRAEHYSCCILQPLADEMDAHCGRVEGPGEILPAVRRAPVGRRVPVEVAGHLHDPRAGGLLDIEVGKPHGSVCVDAADAHEPVRSTAGAATTMIFAVSTAVLKAVGSPLTDMSAVWPLPPLVWSQARNVIPGFTVP